MIDAPQPSAAGQPEIRQCAGWLEARRPAVWLRKNEIAMWQWGGGGVEGRHRGRGTRGESVAPAWPAIDT